MAMCLALGLLTGCSGPPPPPPPPPAPAGNATGSGGEPSNASSAGPSSSTHAPAPAPATPAEAALRLESLLGQHAVLAADLMRGRIRNDEDFGQVASAAIGRNTDELSQLIGSLFGAEAAGRFGQLWAAHVTALFNFSRGLATDDAGVRDESRAQLVSFENDLADFFSTASSGRLPQGTARAAVATHVDHLLQQADAYGAKDYARANTLYRAGYSHTYALGHDLAATLLPPEQAAALQAPAFRLRSELGRLLGEHVALIVAALRAGATNAPDFAAAADSLNGNTSDLTAAMGTLFGAQAGNEFMSLWADHVDQLVAYTSAVAGHDAAGRDAATGKLREFESRLAQFLGTATGNRMAAGDLAKALLAHDEMLVKQVDTFAAMDYQQAVDLAYDTYGGMVGLASQLADAFGETVAARLPQGGAPTGAGGMAGVSGPP